MQKRHWKTHLLLLLIAILNMAFNSGAANASTSDLAPAAETNPPPGPDRFSIIVVEYISYEWNLLTWQDKKLICTLTVDHDGMPLPGEVYRDCGTIIYNNWITQPPCQLSNVSNCEGYYAVLIGSEPKEKEISMQLPAASAWISLEDCEPVFSTSTNICETKPTLVFKGQEPLPNETITRIEGTYGGADFSCDQTDTCKFHIPETGDEGVDVQFWAYSSYGDSSLVYDARVRVKQVDEGDPDQLYWYVDVLSSQWQGGASATCAETWGAFPPVGGAPEWLSTPTESQQLSSDIPYTYLAANLILQGAVDASSCPDGGLSPGNVANQCGLEKSRDAVREWQNQFDGLILSTAMETSVPARLLKNLFARESQFWPGIFQAAGDIGLGQLTENGADTTLFWNTSFYYQFCPLVMDSETCGAGYANLDEELQLELRRALVGSVNAACENCPLGLDLTQADFSIDVFAHTMIANCEQTAQVVYNYTLQSPGEVASYEDLWKFTLVNYNAGGGCLAEAISGAMGVGELPLTWDSVSPYLSGACSSAVDYVNDISSSEDTPPE
ncbi:MAG TPA: hypothetical protein PK414_14050 [Anaerolineales bacterium]|nr:hypothetical protein [Anaerolineales bacterium]HNB37344.1 hypothetical protein [Anaerolineales bacterium]HNC09836.1 hypothetical protein [Anaerolineales bacterium]